MANNLEDLLLKKRQKLIQKNKLIKGIEILNREIYSLNKTFYYKDSDILNDLLDISLKVLNINKADLILSSKKQEIVELKMILSLILKDVFNYTFDRIKVFLFATNHSSILYLVNKWRKRLKEDNLFFNKYNTILAEYKIKYDIS